MKKLLLCAMAALFACVSTARADLIPYGAVGTPNATTYSFTATNTGEVTGYFALANVGAAYTEDVGLLVNGVLTGAGYGLPNHSTPLGTMFDFGAVTAGDSLVFELRVYDLGKSVFSDPSMNIAFDGMASNHIYSTPYTNTSTVDGIGTGIIPPGTYVAFEDLPFSNSDYNYHDEAFVFTNVTSSNTPVPGSLVLLCTGLASFGAFAWMKRRKAKVAA